MSVTTPRYQDPWDVLSPPVPRHTSSYESAGNMVPDAFGNIVGTEETGKSFVWFRR